ncbi:hypothetical protein AAF712_009516 [Marasmius tenuissimus]|uniref:JmjC domain-containing protein n=1 Tax=Marasmius tenuissimus TaxID=585030 RepID=A0ABR2ZQK2_9AGAR
MSQFLLSLQKVSVDHWQVLSDDTLNVKFPLEPPASLKRDNKKNFAKYRPYQGTLSWRNTSSEPSAISSPNTDSIAEQPQPLKRTKTLCSPAVNGWVTNLLSQWNNPFTVSINSSTTVEGILNCIATTSFHIPFFRATLDDQPPKCLIQFHERPSSIIHPHPSLILGDILASEPEDIIVSHTILGHLTDIPTVRDIVYAFLTATTRSSPSHDENEAALYSILKVPFTPDGMGLCQLQSPFPDDFDGVYDRKPPSKSPNWSSAFTPPGSITRPHIDWYGAAEMMYHVSGEKLWLLWPGTPENLETLYNWKHKSPNNDPTITITEAITRLKGLQLVFFSAPCAWELPPCTIHVCLGFSFSGHLGVAFWSPCGFSTAQWTIEFYLITVPTMPSPAHIRLHLLKQTILKSILEGSMITTPPRESRHNPTEWQSPSTHQLRAGLSHAGRARSTESTNITTTTMQGVLAFVPSHHTIQEVLDHPHMLQLEPNNIMVPGSCTVTADMRADHKIGTGGFKTCHLATITLFAGSSVHANFPGLETLMNAKQVCLKQVYIM